MTEDLRHPEHEDIDLLLPWYANGTLDAEETARVEAALETDADLRHSLALIMEDRTAATEALESVPVPGTMEARFLAQLETEIDRARTTATKAGPAGEGLFSRLGSWLLEAATPRNMGLAATAAAVVIAVQAGLLAGLVGTGRDGGAQYETATGQTEIVESGQAFLVQFADGASTAALAEFLESEGARMVDGPLTGGFFRLRFASDDTRDKDAIAAVLKDRPELFRLVLPGG